MIAYLRHLQRLAAVCGPSGSASSGSAAVVAAAASSIGSSFGQPHRLYSDEAEPTPGDGEAAASDGAPSAAAADEEDFPDALIDEDGERLTPDMFSKRQLARMGLGDPDKVKHFLPALSRKEMGSFADDYVAEAFDVEQELYARIPEDKPLYNLRDVVPEIYQPRSELFERLLRLKADHPDMPVAQWAEEVLGLDHREEEPPYPGARRIIRWQIRHVFAVGVNEGHPANRKVKAWVHLRELQRECGLTDAALQHIAAICAQRYNPNTGVLKLTADRYPHREANRAHILRIIDDLVAEGHRRHPAPQQQAAAAEAAQQQQAAEAAA